MEYKKQWQWNETIIITIIFITKVTAKNIDHEHVHLQTTSRISAIQKPVAKYTDHL